MGVDTRKPILPAPTDSTFLDTTGGSGTGTGTGTDIATDLSRRTDKTSYSIPDDGSPITINTRRKSQPRDRDENKVSRSGHNSHTSLLIEYFEGGKKTGNVSSRPSVRVRVTPSSSRRNKERDDHVHITESSSGRKPSYTRRISLGTPTRTKELTEGPADDSSFSGADDTPTTRQPPLEIEFMDQNSAVSSRYIQPTSEISSMPPESLMESTMGRSDIQRRRRHSYSDEEDLPQDDNLLKTPSRRRSRSLSRERIAQKAAEKLSSVPRGHISRPKQRLSERAQSRDIANDVFESDPKARNRPGKHRDKDFMSPESSLLSNSALSHNKGGDQYSFRSGTSRSSLNNPKLLETVEDAIRRLILPELKELKKDQKVQSNRTKFERETSGSHASGSIGSKDELTRRLSKHASAPDEPGVQRKKSKGLRDAEAAKIVGTALTAAALKHHDSTSTLGSRKERRRRRSGSGSIGINETELIFEKHEVPPMPHLRSELESQVTRQSIQSQHSDATAGPVHGEVTRGTIREQGSPVTKDFNVSPQASKKCLKSSRSNLSNPPLNSDEIQEELVHEREASPGADVPEVNVDAPYPLEKGDHHHSEYLYRRALSPIQSVASYQEEQEENEAHGDAYQQAALSHGDHRLSIDSLSSAPSTDLARSNRTTDRSSERRRAISINNESGVELGYGDSPKYPPSGEWPESQHEEYDENRRSVAEESQLGSVDEKRTTMYTDENFDDPLDPGQQVARGIGANAQYIHTPIGVESAVASLLDPSVVDGGSNRSPTVESPMRPRSWGSDSVRELTRDVTVSRKGSPLKQQVDLPTEYAETSFQKRMGASSPPQSVANSTDEEDRPYLGATGLPTAGSPIPEIGHIPESEESEINTNPSIIQGPIGGVPHDGRDHWPFGPTPPEVQRELIANANQYNGTLDPSPMLMGRDSPAGLGVFTKDHAPMNQSYYHPPDVLPNGRVDVISPGGGKDEGYISGANHRSASTVTPEPKGKGGLGALEDIPFSSPMDDEDPYTHKRHLSGYSHGIASPLYDSATGRGIDRIQSKDIVALMDHLTVRDAQRNARDTEILVTLVRSAAEIRNSFEDMKKFIETQDEKLLDTTEKHHGQTQRLLNGPRPQPPRTPRRLSEDDDDTPTKKKNVFKRALKGLGLKSSNDLTHIEDMLLHLLAEVEALRADQRGNTMTETRQSMDNPRGSLDGYGSQGQPTNGSIHHSSKFSNSPRSTGDLKQLSAQREAERRISPVIEDNEDPLTPQEEELLDPQMSTDAHFIGRHKRGDSVPVTTPERAAVASGALSTDTTPKMSTDKSRKHKSSSSSFFPKVSRWSKTTASSMGENIKNSMQLGRKERPYSEMSRSGSDLNLGGYTGNDYYDPQGDDRLRSNASLDRENRQENRPPSPLVPSQVSEHPKYRAHRDSLNLQHPQPRPGARYQTHLESEAQNYTHMESPAMDPWSSTHSLGGEYQHQTQSNAGRRSPFSDGGYSAASSITRRQNGPPRPPKIKDEGPLIPQRPASIKDGAQPSYAERVALRESGNSANQDGQLGSPKSSLSRTGPQRRPTGPRPNPSSGKYSGSQSGFSNVKRHQYRGSPNQIDDEDDDY
ncbi:predicted protein [Uncinocarpus reesii 1704]|uniref:Uncharacterized protein n=1 Tax=Uncinocarpus reesii (strain UAMH 1704) TaxID=336963 RepID=C4JRR5_UNCRE|nr:uncharacterized protein UREG_05154 [Uncinocarpus reesii 1704]EEP80312.1 predicted protein [Uncinocarpus reesii 1704]